MPGGRPSQYKPKLCEKAAALLAGGATDEEVAAELGISARTLYRWQASHPEFCQALKAGKEAPDNRAERSLYQKATGYYFKEQQAFKVKTGPHSEKIEIVEVERYQPPDTTAAIFWLKNRRAEDWRDRSESVIRHITEISDGELERIAAGSGEGTAAAPKGKTLAH